MVLNQVYIFSDIIIYLWDKRSNWSTKNIYDWVTYNRANTIVEQFLNQFWNDGEISDIFLSRTFCPVCIIEFGHTDILSDYVRLPMQIKNPDVHELGSWTIGFRLFCVDRFSRRNSSLSTLKQTNVSPHTHWLHERKKPNRFYSETIVLLHTSRSFPSIRLHSCHNKLLFHTLPLWWHTSRCLKSPLKHVFMFYAVNSHCAVFLRRFSPF